MACLPPLAPFIPKAFPRSVLPPQRQRRFVEAAPDGSWVHAERRRVLRVNLVASVLGVLLLAACAAVLVW